MALGARTVAAMLPLLIAALVGLALLEHPAARHVGRWSVPPKRCPSSLVTDVPLLGNGDAGAAMGGFEMTVDGRTLSQSFYIGKMDFWTQQNLHRSAYFTWRCSSTRLELPWLVGGDQH